MDLLTRIKRRLKRKQVLWQHKQFRENPHELELKRLVAASKSVLDLGCGPNPIEGATVAMDMFLDPRHRGGTDKIVPSEIEKRGIRFVNQNVDARLPFGDGEFEFAYSSHVVEHLEHPGAACDEMMRVARSGLVRCPAPMIEYMIGRTVHHWMIIQRASRLLFIEKVPDDFNVFGAYDAPGDKQNPFDVLLDWDGAMKTTSNRGVIGRLKRRFHDLVYKRMPQTEVNLFWNGGFAWSEYHLDGSLTHGGRPGKAWWFDGQGKRREATA